jgi:hypothetical protein
LEGEPTENPAYARAQEATDYPHLLSGVEWWLPCSFSLVFQAQDGGGAERTFGSSIALVNELRDLNTRTWNADAATIGRWYEKGPPEPGCAVEDGARFAFGMLVDLGEKSVKLRLPMLLDY